MYGKTFNKTATLKMLKEIGATRAELEYSGGNDEGSAYDLLIWNNSNNPEPEIAIPPYYSGGQTFNTVTNTWEDVKKAATSNEQLYELCSDAVYEKWGGFAGDFYVNGKIVFDVENNEVRREENVETRQGSFEKEYL